ncbi:MAG: hypothetical protein ACKVS6_11005 [Planctomycetota bacterium]
MRFRYQSPVLILLICAGASCTTERMGSLRAMGGWAENDVRTFYNDITGAPGWFAGQVKTDVRNFGESMSFVASKTQTDFKTGKEVVTGGPAYLSKEFKRDWRSLSGTVTSMGDWTGQDARELYHDFTGAPAYIVSHSKRELRDFTYQFNELVRQFNDDVRLLPAHVWETIRILFIK